MKTQCIEAWLLQRSYPRLGEARVNASRRKCTCTVQRFQPREPLRRVVPQASCRPRACARGGNGSQPADATTIRSQRPQVQLPTMPATPFFAGLPTHERSIPLQAVPLWRGVCSRLRRCREPRSSSEFPQAEAARRGLAVAKGRIGHATASCGDIGLPPDNVAMHCLVQWSGGLREPAWACMDLGCSEGEVATRQPRPRQNPEAPTAATSGCDT